VTSNALLLSTAVTGVSVTLSPTVAPQGGYTHATAVVLGTNPGQSVTWSLSSAAIAAGLILYTREDGSADVLVPPDADLGTLGDAVIATSDDDNTKSDAADIQVAAATDTSIADILFGYGWGGPTTIPSAGLPRTGTITVTATINDQPTDAFGYDYQFALVTSRSVVPDEDDWIDATTDTIQRKIFAQIPADQSSGNYFLLVRPANVEPNGDVAAGFAPGIITIQ